MRPLAAASANAVHAYADGADDGTIPAGSDEETEGGSESVTEFCSCSRCGMMCAWAKEMAVRVSASFSSGVRGGGGVARSAAWLNVWLYRCTMSLTISGELVYSY